MTTGILCYHSVGEGPLSVKSKDFKNHIQFIQRLNYNITTLSAFMEQNRCGGHKNAILTFDDCFASVYENALPILKDAQVKGTFYACIDYIGKRHWGSLKHQRWSDEQSDEYNIAFDYMTWENLEDLVNSGMEIGAHTITHRNLNELSPQEQEEEIIGSKEILEKRLGIKVDTFCYPRGRFNDVTAEIVRKAGYKAACTTVRGMVMDDFDRFKLARLPGGSYNMAFKANFCLRNRFMHQIQRTVKSTMRCFLPC